MIPRQTVFSSHSSFQAADSASKLAEKWLIPILFSLVWPDRGWNPYFKYRTRGDHANHYTNKAERKMNKYMFTLISWLYIKHQRWFGLVLWFYGVLRHFQQYFSYIVAVSFI